MGGGKSSGSSTGTVASATRYAPYIESAHTSFLATTVGVRNTIIHNSPYIGYTDIDIDSAFFSFGYILSSFPSLYDMFGKSMAGLDIEVLWENMAADVLNHSEIDSDIKTKMEDVNTKIDAAIDKHIINMRNSNSVNSSSFIIGKAVLEDSRTKLLAKISESVRFEVLPNINNKFFAALNWNKSNVKVYAESMKLYYVFKTDVDDANYTNATRDILWPFTVLGFELVSIGALQGTRAFQKTAERQSRSKLSTGLLIASNTATGAYIGSSFGPWGTVIGGVVGFIVGVAMVLFE